MIELKYNNGTKLIQPDDSAYRYCTIMGDNSITLIFDLPDFEDIPVGAYIDYQGERYTLRRPATFVKNGTRNYRYTLILDAPQARLKNYRLYNPVDNRLEFDMHARPIEFAQMIVANLNNREGAGVWSVDNTTLDAEARTIAFSYTTLYEALQMIADEFGTEWEIDDTTLRIGRVEYNKSVASALQLSYGAGNGIEPGTGRANYDQTDAIEILYVQGGERNIDRSTYGKKTLHLPLNKQIRYDGSKFEDEQGYVSANARRYTSDANGQFIKRADKELQSKMENVIDCTHHYPSELHTVTNVILVDEAKHFYDVVIDAPENIPYDSDTLCIIGEHPTIIFQSGMLAGREFDLHTDDAGVIKAEKVLEGATFVGWRLPIIPAELDGVLMPDPATNYTPAVGDTLRVFGITLPAGYICNDATKTGASWRMMREAIRWLYDNETPRFSFTGKLQKQYARDNWGAIGPKIKLGGYVRFSDDQFLQTPQLIRIIGIKDFINDPYAPEIELSNTTCSVGFSSELAKYDADEVRAENAAKSVREYAQRRWRDAKVSQAMIEEALLKEFSNTISPIAVNTMQAIFGAESLQYDFITSLTNDTVVDHALDVTASQLTAPAAFIKHHTIGIDAVQPNRAAGEYLRWSVSALTFALQTDKSYYLYIKASKSSNTATFVASESAIAYDADPDHYHLLYATIGILQGEERVVTKWNGYTEITPGRLTAYKFLSSDGQQYIDFLTKKARIGDANTFLDWNSDGDGKLKIKGTIVQSPSGAESVIGCYRGAFNVNLSYYVGDMVTYQGSTYRCIKDTTTGSTEPPTNTDHWAIDAASGEDGMNGCPLRGVTEWQAGRRYEGGNPRAGDEYQDIVVYDGSFYACTETHTATAAGTPPTLLGTKWKAGSQFDFVATKIAYIKKTLIENAVIDTLQTQEVNGGRIEAIGDRISSYKNNVEKLKIHSGNLSPLAGGGSNTYDIASSSKTHSHTHTGSNPITDTGDGESTLAMVSPTLEYNQVTVPALTIGLTTNASEANDTDATVYWALEFGGILISNGMFNGQGSITTPAKTISLPKGVNSTLKLYYSYELMSHGNSVSFTLASNAKSGNAIVYSVSGFTEVASDGFKSQWASNKYLYIDLDDGMKMQYGNARLELDETNGIKASHIGANDTFAVVAKDIKEIKVVTAMPSTPDNNTLYILTP